MIRLHGVSKRYGSRIVLDEVHYHFPAGERLALVGRNGAGKSTLLRILVGDLEPDAGHLTCPNGLKVAYLPQEPNPAPESTILGEAMQGDRFLAALAQRRDAAKQEAAKDSQAALKFAELEAQFNASGGYVWQTRTASILTGLGFAQTLWEKDVGCLSGGWRMRLELAKVLVSQSRFLVLDEPTNHLDLQAMVWLERFLTSFAGTLLFVSHDRTFLNRLATMTLHLEAGRLEAYKGNYDQFERTREEREKQRLAEQAQLESRQQALVDFARRFGAKATKAKAAQSKLRMAGRLQEQIETLTVAPKGRGIVVPLPKALASDRILLEVSQLRLGYGAHALVQGLDWILERGQRVGVVGVSGAGKSSFLRFLMEGAGAGAYQGGEWQQRVRTQVAYFHQDQSSSFKANSSVLENLLAVSDLGAAQLRKLCGAMLFSGDDVDKPFAVLSGGEKSRVGLIAVLAARANLLLLDEPTNHLDMDAVAVLAQALQSYDGGLVFASHDRFLLEKVPTHILAFLGNGRVQLFEGNLTDFEYLTNLSLGQEQGLGGSGSPKSKGNSVEKQPSGKKAKEARQHVNRLQRQSEQLEKNMQVLRKELSLIDTAMAEASAAADYNTVWEKAQHRDQKQAELDQLEEAWLCLQEQVEASVLEAGALEPKPSR